MEEREREGEGECVCERESEREGGSVMVWAGESEGRLGVRLLVGRVCVHVRLNLVFQFSLKSIFICPI